MSSNVESIARLEAIRTQPEVQERLQAFSRYRVQQILATVGSKRPEAAKPRFMTGEAFNALIATRYKHQAVNALVLNKIITLNPTIGDASCELRVPLVLDFHDRVRALLRDGDTAIVHAHISAHAKDKPVTKIRTLADARGAPHAPEYDDLVWRIETALGEDGMKLAGLCYAFTDDTVWSRDESDFMFGYRSKIQQSGDQKDLIRVRGDLRVDLAHLALAPFLKRIQALPRHEAAIPDAPQFFIENQLLLASQIMNSFIPTSYPFPSQGHDEAVPLLNYEDTELPVLPAFIQLLAIFYMLFNKNRGFITRVRRAEMTPIASNSAKPRFAEKFGGAYYVLSKPNLATGSFDVVEPDFAADGDCSFMVLDTFSKYHVGTRGAGLDSPHLAQHKDALSASNIPWLVVQHAACHPAFAGTAVAKDVDYAELYRTICMPQPPGVAFQPTREHFSEFHMNVNRPGEIRPNLHDLWTLGQKFGIMRDLHDQCQVILGTFSRDLFERINRPVDIQFDHVYATTLNEIEADTSALIAKHTAAPNAVFGPYIVRHGAGCLSYTDNDKVTEVLALRSDAQKKKHYVENHPENASFV